LGADDEDGGGSSESGDGDGESSSGNDGESDSGELGEESGDPTPGNSNSTAEIPDPEFDDEELEEYLDEIIEAVHEDDSVIEEIDRITDAMNDPANIDVIDFGEARFKPQRVGVQTAAVVEQVTHGFRRLYADVEPGWNYGSDVGKLNIGRVISDPDNYDEHFDEWDEGREIEAGLEVFISLDTSGSLSVQQLGLASEAMYIIKRACDDVEANVTVVGFDATTRGLYRRDERASTTEWPFWIEQGGDTQPAHSFHLARSVLSRSSMLNKLFVVITDGGWGMHNLETGGHDDFNELIPSIPGTKVYVGVDSGGANKQWAKFFDFMKEIHNPMDIVPLIDMVITDMIRKVAHGV
jgi:cobalamin biosynthesis protein CobT